MLAFIGWGIEYESQDVMLQLYKTLVRPHLRVLCSILVATLQEGCGGFGEGAEEVYQNAAWIRGYEL